MKEPQKKVLKSVTNWLVLAIAPVALFGWLFNMPIINGIYELGNYTLVLAFCAGMINAIMDVLQFHFSTSVFSKLNKKYHQFWDASVSWKNKYINGDPAQGLRSFSIGKINIPYPVTFTDAWHLFKGLFTISIVLTAITFEPIVTRFPENRLIDFACIYIFYKWAFNAFYNVILVSKKQPTV